MGPLDQRLPARMPHVVLDQHLKLASDDWYVGKSEVAGQGVFAGKDYEPGDRIGIAMTDGDEDEFGAKIWNLTELARYCNHQNKNNVDIEKDDDRFHLVAIEPIEQDEELVSNYWQVARAKGPHSTMLWEGKPVPTSDLEDYVEKGAEAMLWLFEDKQDTSPQLTKAAAEDLQVAKEDDVYVQSAVPAASRELVRKHGLLSSQALLNNPEALKAFLSDRKGTDWEEDEEAFKQRIGEKLKDTFWGDAVKGPSVFFGDPDPDKITDVHPMRKLKAETVRVNLSKLLRDHPKTRIAGSELQPYDPEGPEHQGDLRHYDIDMDKVREYAATAPKELWKHYDEPDGVRYASNVPHAQIITPSGGIPPEYLELQE